MICESLPELKSQLPERGRLLGLDIGMKKIGIALSDEGRLVASAHSILERINSRKDIGRIYQLVKEHQASAVVLGFPYTPEGDEGPMCEEVKRIANKLQKKQDTLLLYYQDERMSTSRAQEVLKEADMTRKKRDAIDDKVAATFILQEVLDQL